MLHIDIGAPLFLLTLLHWIGLRIIAYTVLNFIILGFKYIECNTTESMASIKSGNGNIPPSIIDVKVVVMGEPKCGKTSFIRAFYEHNNPHEIKSFNGVTVYCCEIMMRNKQRRTAIFEVSDISNGPRIADSGDADAIIFMYAIDDPTTLEMLSEKWLPVLGDIIKSNVIPVALVGAKKDLQEDQEVIDRLAVNNKTPVSYGEGKALYEKLRESFNGVAFMECSVNDLQEICEVFDLIFEYSLPEE